MLELWTIHTHTTRNFVFNKVVANFHPFAHSVTFLIEIELKKNNEQSKVGRHLFLKGKTYFVKTEKKLSEVTIFQDPVTNLNRTQLKWIRFNKRNNFLMESELMFALNISTSFCLVLKCNATTSTLYSREYVSFMLCILTTKQENHNNSYSYVYSEYNIWVRALLSSYCKHTIWLSYCSFEMGTLFHIRHIREKYV